MRGRPRLSPRNDPLGFTGLSGVASPPPNTGSSVAKQTPLSKAREQLDAAYARILSPITPPKKAKRTKRLSATEPVGATPGACATAAPAPHGAASAIQVDHTKQTIPSLLEATKDNGVLSTSVFVAGESHARGTLHDERYGLSISSETAKWTFVPTEMCLLPPIAIEVEDRDQTQVNAAAKAPSSDIQTLAPIRESTVQGVPATVCTDVIWKITWNLP